MNILYITYIDMEVTKSGSSVRPVMMYKAMKQLGHQVYLVGGSQERKYKNRRKETVLRAMEWLDSNKPDLCYVESPTAPILGSYDRKLIKKVVSKYIPTAYFYRDMYLKFPHFRKTARRSLTRMAKDAYLLFLQRLTDTILHRVDIVYFPTKRAASYFEYKRALQLMPATNHSVSTQKSVSNKICFYVGGLSDMYGQELLYEAFKLLNDSLLREEYKLFLVCREAEYKRSVFNRLENKKPDWLSVYHVSGYEQLQTLYEQSTVALLPQKPDQYMNMAIAVKFFEYLGEGLPIVSAGALEMSNMIRTNNLGTVTDYSPQAFADGIRDMFEDADRYNGIRQSIADYMKSNLWTDRVKQIFADLQQIEI